jgi:hypothetical protein
MRFFELKLVRPYHAEILCHQYGVIRREYVQEGRDLTLVVGSIFIGHDVMARFNMLAPVVRSSFSHLTQEEFAIAVVGGGSAKKIVTTSPLHVQIIRFRYWEDALTNAMCRIHVRDYE